MSLRVNTLSTPSIISINAFDPRYDYVVEFYYTDSQSVKNRAVIIDNVFIIPIVENANFS